MMWIMQKLQMKLQSPAITPDANVKPAAKQAIADKVQARSNTIDGNNGSTTEEKQLLNNKFKLKNNS